MSPILTGVIASGISGNLTPPWSPEGAYDALATVSLSTATASVTFSGIPTGYKHLQIRYIASSDSSTDGSYNVQSRFNSDSGSNYTLHLIDGNGSSTSAYGTGNLDHMYVGNVTSSFGGFSLANAFGVNIIDVLDYSNTNKFKTTKMLNGYDVNGSGKIQLISNLWRSTTAVTSISINPQIGNWRQYSHFALYGVK